jgi:hypothetical protein
MNYKLRTINYQLRTTNYEQLTTNYEQPTTNYSAKQTQFYPPPADSKNALNLVITMTNNNELLPACGGMNYSKQTQTNPILPAVRLAGKPNLW